MAAADTIPAATACPARSKACWATRSPRRAASARSAAEDVPDQPWRRAQATMLGPLAMASTQPRPRTGHRSPSRSTIVWPMWPALPATPGDELAALYQPAAHTGGDDEHHDVVDLLCGTAPVFAGRRADPVAGQVDRHVREEVAEPGGQRESAPAVDGVDRADRAGRQVERPGRTDADTGQRTGLRARHRPGQRGQGFPRRPRRSRSVSVCRAGAGAYRLAGPASRPSWCRRCRRPVPVRSCQTTLSYDRLDVDPSRDSDFPWVTPGTLGR